MAGAAGSMPWNADPARWPPYDLIGLGSVIDPDVVLEAYRSGVFPMPVDSGRVGWWSPLRRGVLPVDGLRVTRSMRRSARRYSTTVDAAFEDVLIGCGDPGRTGGWIDRRVVAAYTELHRRGRAHSIEVWQDGTLTGGLYGVALGGLFAGESMFSRQRDASKVALMRLADILTDGIEGRLFDVQWRTDHLASLGTVEIDRAEFLRRLRKALVLAEPDWGRGPA